MWGKRHPQYYLTDMQLLLPSLKDVTLSSSWIPALSIPPALFSPRSKTKCYLTRRNSIWTLFQTAPSWKGEQARGVSEQSLKRQIAAWRETTAYINSGSYHHLPNCIHLFWIHLPKKVWILLVERHQCIKSLQRNHFSCMMICTSLMLSLC